MMREKIYTILINEAFDKKSGCPICRIRAHLDDRENEIITGGAMMEPDIRIDTNRKGFCRKHYADMLSSGKNRLPVALMLETHLMEQILTALAAPPKSAKAVLKERAPWPEDQVASCYICGRVESNIKNVCSNIIYLYKTEPEFKDKLRAQQFFCLAHLGDLQRAGASELGKAHFAAFSADIYAATRAYFEKLARDVSIFSKSFDYRAENCDAGAKTSIEAAVSALTPLG